MVIYAYEASKSLILCLQKRFVFVYDLFTELLSSDFTFLFFNNFFK